MLDGIQDSSTWANYNFIPYVKVSSQTFLQEEEEQRNKDEMQVISLRR